MAPIFFFCTGKLQSPQRGAPNVEDDDDDIYTKDCFCKPVKKSLPEERFLPLPLAGENEREIAVTADIWSKNRQGKKNLL